LKLLLDTHVILWSAAEPEKLPSKIVEELKKESNYHHQRWWLDYFSPERYPSFESAI